MIDAATSDLKPFARLAAGMTDDLDAITNALRYPWSTGPLEGHITRVKLIKRAGYGRAKLPLLRARILGPNRARTAELRVTSANVAFTGLPESPDLVNGR